MTVSPGHPERLDTAASSAPTFSWSASSSTAGEGRFELVVYELPGSGSPVEAEIAPVLRQVVPSFATSWTPSLEQSLAPGEYAWFVRRIDGGGEQPWSEARLFRVPDPRAAAPSARLDAPEPAGSAAVDEPERPAEQGAPAARPSTERRPPTGARRATASAVMPQLRVAGIIDATTFTGDGSALSGVATDAELQAHVGDAAAHGTCDGQPCNGLLFSNVTAVAGDSATDFFATGALAEARIDDALARDVEVAALLGGPTLVRVTADGTPTENGAALEAAIAGISDASTTQRYVVLLGPGIYDVGSDGVTLKPFVDLQGTSVSSTIVTGTGDEVSGDLGTLVLVDDVVAERLTIRNTGGGIWAYGVRGAGARFRLQDARIEITSNGASFAVGFSGVNLSGSFEHFGELVRVDIVVDEGDGIGGFAGSGELLYLHVDDCRITVQGEGTGITDDHFDSLDGVLLVTDTLVEVLGGGIGVDTTWAELQLFRNVIVAVSGGTGSNSGFQGFGSGFRPTIESSRISVDGTDSAGIRTNNGTVTVHGTSITATGSSSKGVDANAAGSFLGFFHVRNSTIVANIGFELVSATGGHQVRVEHSTFDVSTGFRTSSSGGGVHSIRLGSSKLDASSTNVQQVTAGSASPVCVASYDENFVALAANCG